MQANQLLEEDNLDLVIIGKSFLANPGLVFAFADELEVDVRMPNQIEWAVCYFLLRSVTEVF